MVTILMKVKLYYSYPISIILMWDIEDKLYLAGAIVLWRCCTSYDKVMINLILLSISAVIKGMV